MKQILTTLMLVIAVVLPVFAADTHDDMYMDMAVVTAKKAVRNAPDKATISETLLGITPPAAMNVISGNSSWSSRMKAAPAIADTSWPEV